MRALSPLSQIPNEQGAPGALGQTVCIWRWNGSCRAGELLGTLWAPMSKLRILAVPVGGGPPKLTVLRPPCEAAQMSPGVAHTGGRLPLCLRGTPIVLLWEVTLVGKCYRQGPCSAGVGDFACGLMTPPYIQRVCCNLPGAAHLPCPLTFDHSTGFKETSRMHASTLYSTLGDRGPSHHPPADPAPSREVPGRDTCTYRTRRAARTPADALRSSHGDRNQML